MSGLSPLATTMGTPAEFTLRAALILLIIPPVPRGPGMLPAAFSVLLVMTPTTGMSSASGSVRGSRVNRPSMSLRMTSRSASMSSVIIAARLSLSPSLISSTETVSFSLMMGTIFQSRRVFRVLRAFR